MAKYTVQVRHIVEQACDDAGHSPTEQNWKDAWAACGLADYPIFEESYREVLNAKIIRRYFMREIGLETAGLWRFYMRERMWDVMTYYNQLYKSADLVTDPLNSESMTYNEMWNRANTGSLDEKTSSTESVKGTDTTETANEYKGQSVYSDTPMDMLQDTPSKVENLEYATNVTFDENNTEAHTQGSNTRDTQGSGTRENDTTANEDGTRTRTEEGYRTPQAELLKKYRETMLNIDQMVVNELSDLFMTVY